MAPRRASAIARHSPGHDPAAGGLSRSLTVPRGWAEELSALRHPDLREPVVGPETLILSYDPARARDWGIDLREIAADLSMGMTLRSGRPHKGSGRFYATGTRFRVEVISRPAKNTRRPLAFAARVYRNDEQLPRRTGRLTRRVRFAEVWDEEECDIGLLHGEGEQARRRQGAIAGAGKILGRTSRDKSSFQHAELHTLARQRYGTLRALLTLLRHRAEQAAVTADGVVIRTPANDGDADDPYLYIRLAGRRSFHDFDGALVELEEVGLDGKAPRTSVRDVTDQVLALDLPRRGEWAKGSQVSVTTVPRFAMKQHDIALRDFLAGQIEGNWDDLAALLCKPGRLQLPSRPMPPRFFCDEDPNEVPLNEQQRSAVAGALATSHAFVIQGPPGTGKTTVICELVRQLVARGERVLMLAPSHVAVDEVLRRIGRKPGIRPLRLSWEESRVAEELRCFLPDRAGAEFAARLRTPGADSDTRWQSRHDSLRSEAAALDRLATALRAQEQAESAHSRAESDVAEARHGLDEARRNHARIVAARSDGIAAAERDLDRASDAVERAHEAEGVARDAFDRERQPMDEVLAAARLLMETKDALAAGYAAEREASSSYSDWYTRWNRDVEITDRSLADIAPALAAATNAANLALARLQEAEAAWRSVPTNRGALQRLADRFGVGVMARRAGALRRAHEVWVLLDRDRQGYQLQRQRLTSARQRLHFEDRAKGEGLAEAVNAARASHGSARREHEVALSTWAETSAAVTGSALPLPGDAASLARQLTTVLAEPDSDVALPSGLAPPDFDEARDGLRAAIEQRLSRQRDRLLADDRAVQARRALVETQGNHQAEEADLVAALDRARADVSRWQTESASAAVELGDAMIALGYRTTPSAPEVGARRARLNRQLRVLPAYAGLRRRWVELVSDSSQNEISKAVGDALQRSVNVVCATTAGIATRLGDADFDTLIVDEASRVIDSEFLIGASRARRWVLVGDEHQLPPHVDNQDEHHLHALAALHRHQRGVADSVDGSAEALAEIWAEDDEQRRFRTDQVKEVAKELRTSGDWPDLYGETFNEAHQHLRTKDGDPDRELLRSMRRHLVQSLLERVVAASHDSLRQPLVVQRRMIPPLAAIVKEPIYQGSYDSPDVDDLRSHGVHPLTTSPTFTRPVVLLDTSSNPQRRDRPVGHGYENKLERDWIVEACRRYEREMSRQEKRVTVSVLCFYQAQVELIRRALKPPRYPGFRRLKFRLIAPIDKAQGQESDLVFVSFGRSRDRPGPNYGQWLQDVRRLNVACTRAHRALVLVGHGDMLRQLRAFPRAQMFYANLFELFSTDHFLLIDDFLSHEDKRQ